LSPLPDEQDEDFEIAGFYGLGFIMCIVYIVLAVDFVALLLVFRKVKCTGFVDLMMDITNPVFVLGQASQRRGTLTICGPLADLFLSTDYGPFQDEDFLI
jgi:hypothetical protein